MSFIQKMKGLMRRRESAPSEELSESQKVKMDEKSSEQKNLDFKDPGRIEDEKLDENLNKVGDDFTKAEDSIKVEDANLKKVDKSVHPCQPEKVESQQQPEDYDSVEGKDAEKPQTVGDQMTVDESDSEQHQPGKVELEVPDDHDDSVDENVDGDDVKPQQLEKVESKPEHQVDGQSEVEQPEQQVDQEKVESEQPEKQVDQEIEKVESEQPERQVDGQSEVEKKHPLFLLPDEVLVEIVSWIRDPFDKFRLGATCHSLHLLIADKQCWRHEMLLQFGCFSVDCCMLTPGDENYDWIRYMSAENAIKNLLPFTHHVTKVSIRFGLGARPSADVRWLTNAKDLPPKVFQNVELIIGNLLFMDHWIGKVLRQIDSSEPDDFAIICDSKTIKNSLSVLMSSAKKCSVSHVTRLQSCGSPTKSAVSSAQNMFTMLFKISQHMPALRELHWHFKLTGTSSFDKDCLKELQASAFPDHLTDVLMNVECADAEEERVKEFVDQLLTGFGIKDRTKLTVTPNSTMTVDNLVAVFLDDLDEWYTEEEDDDDFDFDDVLHYDDVLDYD